MTCLKKLKLWTLLLIASPWTSAYGEEKPSQINAIREQFDLKPFYQKALLVEGFPIVSSSKVSDHALEEAAWLIRKMVGHKPVILRTLASNNVRFSIMAVDEMTTDLPEHSDLKPKAYWDRRARGLGATKRRPAVSCGEENLLHYHGDPYSTENILIHEFAHAVHEMGLNYLDKRFDKRLNEAYEAAMAAGLWKGKYASNNRMEYWAEAVQSWFDTNRETDHDHNHVNTRDELKAYDPGVAKLVEEVFGDGDWRYTRATDRATMKHLAGYEAEKAPRFVWPKQKENNPVVLSLAQADMPASSGEGVETSLVFQNQRSETVKLMWIDQEKQRKDYGILRPGHTAVQNTFAGHVWLVTDDKDEPIGWVRATDKEARAIVR